MKAKVVEDIKQYRRLEKTISRLRKEKHDLPPERTLHRLKIEKALEEAKEEIRVLRRKIDSL